MILPRDPLDDDFPLGDGSADMEAEVVCPYCGEEMVIALDPGNGSSAEYIEDCQVCCQPWNVRVEYDSDGTAHVTLDTAD
jgi:hypothetical protein